MKCKFIKDTGDQCRANAGEVGYCYLHNPHISEEEKREAQTRGGQARALIITTPLPAIPLNEPNDAILLMADTINQVRTGNLDIKTANCIGFLTDKLLKAYEVAKLNDKVEFIEKVINKRDKPY